jgi:16S rRNA (adenine1518-N6/adenine1519-N6)-dimethyltransferase
MDRKTVEALLRQVELRPAKRLGQNFLVDERVLAEIGAIVAREGPERVLEIGAGLGAVTKILLGHVPSVTALEVDRRLAGLLEERHRGEDRLRVVCSDILAYDLEDQFRAGPVYVVGSLPYRITAPILRWLIEQRSFLSGALLITQREVAEKIAASPGKDGSALGILVRAYAETRIVRRIGPKSFFPVPEVDSALWTISFLARRRFSADEETFWRTVRVLYTARRKMLRRALRDLVTPETVEAVLVDAGLDGDVRGETLGFEALDRLAHAVGKVRTSAP